jgi:hypothetical protein
MGNVRVTSLNGGYGSTRVDLSPDQPFSSTANWGGFGSKFINSFFVAVQSSTSGSSITGAGSSPPYFVITAPTPRKLVVLTPTTGSFPPGSSIDVTWTSTATVEGTVSIFLMCTTASNIAVNPLPGENITTIARSLPVTQGSHLWTVPIDDRWTALSKLCIGGYFVVIRLDPMNGESNPIHSESEESFDISVGFTWVPRTWAFDLRFAGFDIMTDIDTANADRLLTHALAEALELPALWVKFRKFRSCLLGASLCTEVSSAVPPGATRAVARGRMLVVMDAFSASLEVVLPAVAFATSSARVDAFLALPADHPRFVAARAEMASRLEAAVGVSYGSVSVQLAGMPVSSAPIPVESSNIWPLSTTIAVGAGVPGGFILILLACIAAACCCCRARVKKASGKDNVAASPCCCCQVRVKKPSGKGVDSAIDVESPSQPTDAGVRVNAALPPAREVSVHVSGSPFVVINPMIKPVEKAAKVVRHAQKAAQSDSAPAPAAPVTAAFTIAGQPRLLSDSPPWSEPISFEPTPLLAPAPPPREVVVAASVPAPLHVMPEEGPSFPHEDPPAVIMTFDDEAPPPGGPPDCPPAAEAASDVAAPPPPPAPPAVNAASGVAAPPPPPAPPAVKAASDFAALPLPPPPPSGVFNGAAAPPPPPPSTPALKVAVALPPPPPLSGPLYPEADATIATLDQALKALLKSKGALSAAGFFTGKAVRLTDDEAEDVPAKVWRELKKLGVLDA